MPREYRHIQQYEEEMLKLKAEGLTVREIGERFGLSYEKTHDFFKRYNRKQRKIAAGLAIKRPGRPARIKSLEMENELMRDFLSLTERK